MVQRQVPEWLSFLPTTPDKYEELAPAIPVPRAVRSYAEGSMTTKLYGDGLIVVFDAQGIARAFYEVLIWDNTKSTDDVLVAFTAFPLILYSALALTCTHDYPSYYAEWQKYAMVNQDWNNWLSQIDLETVKK